MIKVSESLNGAIENFLEVTPEVISHMADKDNPHAVTKEQVGLSALKNEEQATKAEFNGHKENKQNPHAVTKEQIGLSLVKNEEQATAAEFQAHITGENYKHSADNVLYDEGKTVKEKLDEVQMGSGTIDHAELINRDAAAAHPISAIEGLEEKIEEFESLSAAAGEVEKIKTEMEKGPIYLTGKLLTTTYNQPTKIMLEGDERFVNGGSFTMPQGSACELYISLIAVQKSGTRADFMQLRNYSGRCMKHYDTLWPVLSEIVEDSYFPGMIPNNDEIAPPYNQASYATDDDGLTFTVSGDSTSIYWGITIEVKNFVKVGE